MLIDFVLYVQNKCEVSLTQHSELYPPVPDLTYKDGHQM